MCKLREQTNLNSKLPMKNWLVTFALICVVFSGCRLASVRYDPRDAYHAIHNEIIWNDWLYFSVSGNRWRIGPDPKMHTFLTQMFTGTDWKNQSHWTTMTTVCGGEQEDEWLKKR